MTQAVNNTLRVELLYTKNGQIMENVFHVKLVGLPIVADAIALAGDIATWVDTYLKVDFPTSMAITGIRVTDLTETHGFQILYNVGMPIVGTSASPGLPNNVTVAVKFLTNMTGRSYAGRLFHAALTTGDTTGNLLSTGTAASLKELYERLLTAVNAEGRAMVVVSRWAGKATRGTPLATPITAVSVDEALDSQRRRLTGRGQ